MAKVIGSELESFKKKRMNPVLKVLLIVIGVFVLVIGGIVVHDLYLEDILTKEIQAYMDKDYFEDDFVVEIKTSGDYATIELEIKNYLKEVSDLAKNISSLEEDEEFINILSVENFKNYGPDFVDSFAKLEEVRNHTKSTIDRFCEITTEEYVDSLIERHHLDSYYVDLFHQYMYSEEDLKEMQETREMLIELGEKFAVFLDDCENILTFLKDHGNDWIVEGGSVIFRTDELLLEYQNLSSKLLEDSDF